MTPALCESCRRQPATRYVVFRTGIPTVFEVCEDCA